VPGRSSTAAYMLLIAVTAVGVAEATLLTMLFLFSSILKLKLGVEVGPAGIFFTSSGCCGQVQLYNAATVGSLVFTAGCGAGAAVWKFQHWRPPR